MRTLSLLVLLTAPVALAQAPAAPVEPAAPVVPASADASPSTPVDVPAAPATHWYDQVTPLGYLKFGYFAVVPPSSNDTLVGAHNGFRLANLRVGASMRPFHSVEVVATVDLAVPHRQETDPLNGSRVVALADGFMEWRAMPSLGLKVGQFKAPYSAESLLGEEALPFISRSVTSDGVLPPEGYGPQQGLSLDRQVGVQLSSERLGDKSGLGFRYAFMLANGNGPNVLTNDNNSVTPMLRLTGAYGDWAQLSVNGYYDVLTQGARPSRLTDVRLGFGADLVVKALGFDALLAVLGRRTTHPSTSLPAELALGYTLSLRYVHEATRLEGGVRYARYDPSSVQPYDAVGELAAMVGYRMKHLPVRALLQYTLRSEEPPLEVPNNSLDVMAQLTW